MLFCFAPAIADTLRVPLPAHAAAVHIHISAALTCADHDQLNRQGAVLQVWSDLPRDGQPAGEWGALDFHPVHSSALPRISLRSLDYDVPDDNMLTLYASVSLQSNVARASQSRFSLTYRLLYPSGEIKWLGQFGQNGTLVLEHADPAFVLYEGWSNNGNSACIWDAPERIAGVDVQVARLANPSDYKVWAIGNDSFLGDAQNASLLFFVPLARNHSVVAPQTYILNASADSTISLSSSGVFTFSGSGSLLLQTYDTNTDLHAFTNKIIAHSSPNSCRLIASDTNSGHIFIASPNTTQPSKVAILPLGPRHPAAERQPQIEFETLAALLPEDAFKFCIFSLSTLNAQFYTRPVKGGVQFPVNAAGGQFVLSPVHDLSDRWQVAMLSPYSVAQVPPDSGDILPTPPPSPHMRPVVSSSPSRPKLVPSVDTDVSDSEKLVAEKTVTPRSDRPRNTMLGYKGYILSVTTILITILQQLYRNFFARIFSFGSLGRSKIRPNVNERNNEGAGTRVHVEGEKEKEDVDLDRGSTDAESESENEAGEPPSTSTGNRKSTGSMMVDIKGGPVDVLLHSTMATGSADDRDVAIEMNGQLVEATVIKFGPAESYMVFDGSKGGSVRIRSAVHT